MSENEKTNRIIKEGYIQGTNRHYTIVEKAETGEIYCNTLNSYFRVARNYAQYTQIGSALLDRQIYEEEMEGERNMLERFGPSMGR